jgi:polyisoprenoid-binding protein YceI
MPRFLTSGAKALRGGRAFALLFGPWVLGTPVATAQSGSQPYRLDPTHTTVHWEVVHMGTSTSRGRFESISGQAVFDPGQRLEVDIQIDTASVSTGIRPFDNVLKGSNFLAVTEHPRARFVAGDVRWGPTGLAPAELRGEITLRGRTQPLTLTAERWHCGNNPIFGREVCGGDFTAVLSRSAFGMGFASSMADDRVRLMVQVEAIRTEPGDTPPPGAAR